MANNLVWIEDSESRQATICRKGKKAASTYTKSWKITGTTDDVIVHADVNQKLTGSYEYWQYPGVSGMKLRAEEYTVSYIGGDIWQLSVRYEKNGAEDGTQPLKRGRSFDTTGGTQHITQAFGENRFGTNAPDQKMAIGVDSNGVNGVDVVLPALQWQETYDVPNGYVTSTWIRSVAGVTGTTNSGSFRGFQPGEVLFVGCCGSQEWDSQKGDGPWSLAFRFVASQNVTGQTIGDISGVSKKGHEYLWVRYEETVDQNTLLKKPKHVYVNKVYRDSDFSVLGIGVS
jgi:hypothetical protein